MRRNVLATEFLFPMVLGMLLLTPVIVAWMAFGWSRQVLSAAGIVVTLLMVFIAKPVQGWLAPRIGIPAPRQVIAVRRSEPLRDQRH